MGKSEMSFEGYYEYICEWGHQFAVDVYSDTERLCPKCNGKIAWYYLVDQTNGPGESPRVKILRKETETIVVENNIVAPLGEGWKTYYYS